jgi:hypothetical protein
VHGPIKFVAFNSNGIGRQHYEVSKEIDDYIDVTPFLETHLKPYERSFIPNYHVYRTDPFPGIKGGIALAVMKSIPHNHVDLPSLVSIKATRVYILDHVRDVVISNPVEKYTD